MRFVSFVVMAFLAFSLSGCFDGDEASVRFKITAKAVVDGKPVENSSVMEVTWTDSSRNLLSTRGTAFATGEATVLDLGKRGKVFVLPWMGNPDGSFGAYFEVALPQTFGLENRMAKLDSSDFAALRALKVGQKFSPNYLDPMVKKDFKPFMVMLRDPADPSTVAEVTKDNFSKLFGEGAVFEGLSIEITDQPVTKGVATGHLPLLKDRKRIWSQRPRNIARLQLPPMNQQPLNWRMRPSLFFAFGNY